MTKCDGKVIAITGPRKTEELATFIRRQGGIPIIRPMQGKMFEQFEQMDSEVNKFIDKPIEWAVWMTDTGLYKLIGAAREAGKEQQLLLKLKKIHHVAQGYKIINALQRLGIIPDVHDYNGHTIGLLRSMRMLDPAEWEGSLVSLQLHGEPVPMLKEFLNSVRAQVIELMPYRRIGPEATMLKKFTTELIDGQIDAVVATSAPQIRFLFAYAREKGITKDLTKTFQEQTLFTAIGKATVAAAIDEGIKRVLIPEKERMRSLITTFSRWFNSI